MVAGHLREKSGYYYAVLNYTDSLGKRKTKWISTGLTVKGNKKRAEAILMDARRNFNPEEPKVMNGDILFADYMEKWLDIIKSSVAVPTLFRIYLLQLISTFFIESCTLGAKCSCILFDILFHHAIPTLGTCIHKSQLK